MKGKFYCFIIVTILFFATTGNAQCPAGRYLYPELFTDYTMVTDTYSTANSYTALVDIYQPAGDTLAARPLIILAHAGTFVSGTRNDDVTVDSLCVRFAKRGYVTASIEYRLGNPLSMLTDSTAAITEVVQAISDGKAAIRYFVKDRATVNNFRIDTNNIFVGGNSAGAVLYMKLAYIDSVGECPPDLQAAMAANGGFEGNSGNAGYSTKFKGVINLAGALSEVQFVGPGDVPSVNAQGDLDSTVPYNCGYPNVGFGFSISVTLCGLGQLEPRYDSEGIYHMSHVFPGQGHIPWSTDSGMFVTVDSMVQQFLFNEICVIGVGVPEVATMPTVNLYPNPAHDAFSVTSSHPLSTITISDLTGRVLVTKAASGADQEWVNTTSINTGVYFATISFTDKNILPVTRKLVIQ